MTNTLTNVSVAALAPGSNEITPAIEDMIIAAAVAIETARALAAENALSQAISTQGSQVSQNTGNIIYLTDIVSNQGTQQTTNTNAISVIQSTLPSTEQKANKGATNGYAALVNGTVPLSQLPSAVVGGTRYVGTWDANVNNPPLTSGLSSAGAGSYYIVGVAGNSNLDGINNWGVGDWLVFNGNVWEKLDGQANPVSSVAGRQGAIVLSIADIVGALPSSSGTATNLSLTADPTIPLGAATKQYVDTLVSGVAKTFTKTTYSSSGTISPTDNLSILNSSSDLTMTLANGTVDNHQQTLKQFGSGNVSITGSFDGITQNMTLSTPPPSSGYPLIYSAVTVRYILALNTYIVE